MIATSFVASAAVGAQVGSWTVTIEKDPFSTKKKSIAAMPDSSGRTAALAIRCFPESGLSTVLMLIGLKHQFDAGAKVPFKYRADEGEVVQDEGQAFGSGLIELPNARQVLDDAAKANRLYFRVTDPESATSDITFTPRFSVKALAQINSDCSEGAVDKQPK